MKLHLSLFVALSLLGSVLSGPLEDFDFADMQYFQPDSANSQQLPLEDVNEAAYSDEEIPMSNTNGKQRIQACKILVLSLTKHMQFRPFQVVIWFLTHRPRQVVIFAFFAHCHTLYIPHQAHVAGTLITEEPREAARCRA